MGAITSTVAALFRKGVTAIASTIISPSATSGGTPPATRSSPAAIRSVPPVAWMALLTGISAASSTITGHSIDS